MQENENPFSQAGEGDFATVEQSAGDVDATPIRKRTRKTTTSKASTSTKRNSRGESATSARRIAAVEVKQLQALEYRKMGYTYAQIAEALQYKTAQGAYLAIRSALTRIIREPAEEVLQIEIERLDSMFSKPYQAACSGDLMAINSCLAIMARKAKLLGLDAPVKQEVSGPAGGPITQSIVAVHSMSQADIDAAAKRLLDKY